MSSEPLDAIIVILFAIVVSLCLFLNIKGECAGTLFNLYNFIARSLCP